MYFSETERKRTVLGHQAHELLYLFHLLLLGMADIQQSIATGTQ